MLGTYDFCGYYENTFQWLENQGGYALLDRYWKEAISLDSQAHARALIIPGGIDGMLRYWGHTLAEESPDQGYRIQRIGEVVRFDISDCPSKGFLIRNGLQQYDDYCDHCIGWVAPVIEEAGFEAHHEHNHCGQCWWEFRKQGDPQPPSAPGETGDSDVRTAPNWIVAGEKIDHFSPKRENNEADC